MATSAFKGLFIVLIVVYFTPIFSFQDNSDSQLITLLILTDMFATIAYGGSSHGYKIMCSSEELTQIISYGEMELYCRRPFMKFLIWVHMNGEDIKELNLFFSKHER